MSLLQHKTGTKYWGPFVSIFLREWGLGLSPDEEHKRLSPPFVSKELHVFTLLWRGFSRKLRFEYQRMFRWQNKISRLFCVGVCCGDEQKRACLHWNVCFKYVDNNKRLRKPNVYREFNFDYTSTKWGYSRYVTVGSFLVTGTSRIARNLMTPQIAIFSFMCCEKIAYQESRFCCYASPALSAKSQQRQQILIFEPRTWDSLDESANKPIVFTLFLSICGFASVLFSQLYQMFHI